MTSNYCCIKVVQSHVYVRGLRPYRCCGVGVEKAKKKKKKFCYYGSCVITFLCDVTHGVVYCNGIREGLVRINLLAS